MLKCTLGSLLVVGGMSVGCLASDGMAAIVSDSFDYAPGNLEGSGVASGGWSGAWDNTSATDWQMSTGSLSYSNLQTAGNRLQESNRATRTAKRAYAITGYNDAGDSLWFSGLVNISDVTTGSAFKFFAAGTGNDNGGLGYEITISGNPKAAALKVRNAGGTSAGTLPINFDQTYFIVGRIGFTASNVSTHLWLNPATNANLTNASTGDLSLTSSPSASERGGNVFVGSFSNTAAGFDELRIGESFADVSVVPEPTMLAWVGCALLAARRRR
jgi:hypothetical protein